MLAGALALPEPDGDHLDDAALEPAAEIGVWLNPRNGHNGVSLQRISVPPDRLVPGVGPDLNRGHIGLHRHAERDFRDAVFRKELALAFAGRAAVAAHCRDDERFGA